ncbi:SAF domain-containing protein [Streptomyces sp. NBC_00144]|uniref:SAF domain-containing protein n=1 Tax=Streptomyces sp. NBC_00144 TaxID=2975665 RepID=UPI0032553ECB
MDTTTPPLPPPRVEPPRPSDLGISTGAKKRPTRKWSLLAVAVLMVLVGALVGAVAVARAGDRVSVLALSRDVPAGHRITDQDLVSASFAEDPQLTPVLAADRAQVVGQRAAVDLRRGGLLTRSELSRGGGLGDDRQLVGVDLKRGQVPRDALLAGDKVLAVFLPVEGAAPDSGKSSSSSSEESIEATVVSVGPVDASGSVTVNLAVAQTDGTQLAVKAAAKQVALVREPRG